MDLAAKKEAASPKKSMRLHATLFCSNQDAKGCFPINIQCYFTVFVERRVTSCAPPSTIEVEDTKVILAFS